MSISAILIILLITVLFFKDTKGLSTTQKIKQLLLSLLCAYVLIMILNFILIYFH